MSFADFMRGPRDHLRAVPGRAGAHAIVADFAAKSLAFFRQIMVARQPIADPSGISRFANHFVADLPTDSLLQVRLPPTFI
jgi:hypothetical protein